MNTQTCPKQMECAHCSMCRQYIRRIKNSENSYLSSLVVFISIARRTTSSFAEWQDQICSMNRLKKEVLIA